MPHATWVRRCIVHRHCVGVPVPVHDGLAMFWQQYITQAQTMLLQMHLTPATKCIVAAGSSACHWARLQCCGSSLVAEMPTCLLKQQMFRQASCSLGPRQCVSRKPQPTVPATALHTSKHLPAHMCAGLNCCDLHHRAGLAST